MQIQRYVSKISGPLLDRIDIHIDVPAVKYKELRGDAVIEGSAAIRQRVIRAPARPNASRAKKASTRTLKCRPDSSASTARSTPKAKSCSKLQSRASGFPPARTTAF